MNWLEKEVETNKVAEADAARTKVLDEERGTSLPVIVKEADAGVRPFAQVELQPVKSPGIYEGEFGVKGSDLIFHFWPSGYHAAERRGAATPKFDPHFEAKLKEAFDGIFEGRRMVYDRDLDMGAWFVKAIGWAENQFHRDLCIKACEKLHALLGGQPG